MDKYPQLSNYQYILDNFDALTVEDLEITDVKVDLFLKELDLLVQNYRENGETTHPSEADPLLRTLDSQSVINSILGSGSYGSIVKYQNKAMKIFHYFPLDINFREAVMIYKTDTHYVFSPDIFEGICSIYINKMLQKYSDCYYDTYGVYVSGFNNIIQYKNELPFLFRWSLANEYHETFTDLSEDEMLRELEKHNDTQTVAIVFDVLSPLPDDWYRHKIGTNDIYYILYIILHNVYILQNICTFVHGDLHIGNLLAKLHKKDIQLAYEDEIIILPSKGYAPVMIDFGFSSFDREGRRVVTTKEPLTASGSSYNSYYDVAKLLWSLIKSRYIIQQGYEDIEEIFLYKTGNPVEAFIKTDDKEVNFMHLMQNKLLKPIGEILEYLLTKLQYTKKSQEFNFSRYVDDFNDIIREDRKHVKITNGVTYDNIVYDTAEPYWKLTPYSTKLNIHLIEIKGKANYKFVNKCCKQTVFDMTKHEGVAINGTYFDLNTGNYIKEYNTTYIDHLGLVTVTSDNVTIEEMTNKILPQPGKYGPKPYQVPDQYTKYNSSTFVSNPVLVSNRKPVYFDLQRRTPLYGHPDFYDYTCEDVADIYAYNPGEYRSCKFIKPGELSHLGNSNPRTILATKGNITYFIVIVGRTDEYTGASVEQMQNFLVNYLHVDYAINLDGGASSLMMWNIKGKVYTPLNTVHRKVVSNVIGYIRK